MKSAKSGHFELTEFLQRKPKGTKLTRLRKNTAIFLQGDKSNGLFLIDKGRVKLTAVSSRGKQAIVAVLKDGDFLGEECLSSTNVRITTATTMSECSLLRIPKDALERLILRDPSFARFLVQRLVLRSVRCEQDLINSLFISIQRRLAQVLMSLAQLENGHNIEGVTLKISQQKSPRFTPHDCHPRISLPETLAFVHLNEVLKKVDGSKCVNF
jgi:CRP/FNR family transcriptional regulator, cyclic AMP receptor protein